MIRCYRFIILLLLLFSTTVSAIDYKEYKSKKSQIDYFEIQYSRKNEKSTIKYLQTDNISQRIQSENFIIDQSYISLEKITNVKINEIENQITISFYTSQDSSKLARFKKGNHITVDEDIYVSQDDFVRGMIFSVSGDITISGEVNKDVISLFGNIKIVGDGVVRGNVATIHGKISIESSAIVYGELYDKNSKGRGQKHRLFRDKKAFDVDGYFSYDRVDGFGVSAKAYYNDIDSILPRLETEIGIGFASDRGRYKFLIEQTLFREKAIVLGGTFYKQLLSDDDWLIGKNENTAFALLAKEDYKDYYEAEGGSLYLKALPSNNFTIKAGYSFYASNWLPSNRHLWALLRGSDKLFDPNFGSWEPSIRPQAIAEVETSDIGSLIASMHYYSDSTRSETNQSNWHFGAELEFSQKGLNSDYDYHRYILSIDRLQIISEQSKIKMRTIFGNSNGYLPIFKRFYLGGLGSMHGYDLKEMIGTRFWMVNSEYKIDFPKSDFGVSLFWDIGQIANDQKLNSEVDIKQSLGLSFFFDDDFNISVAKRLDRSTNDSPKLYVRFNQIF